MSAGLRQCLPQPAPPKRQAGLVAIRDVLPPGLTWPSGRGRRASPALLGGRGCSFCRHRGRTLGTAFCCSRGAGRAAGSVHSGSHSDGLCQIAAPSSSSPFVSCPSVPWEECRTKKNIRWLVLHEVAECRQCEYVPARSALPCAEEVWPKLMEGTLGHLGHQQNASLPSSWRG